jgi:hypothetical protein
MQDLLPIVKAYADQLGLVSLINHYKQLPENLSRKGFVPIRR